MIEQIEYASTWKTQCGIAHYTNHLTKEMLKAGKSVIISAKYPQGDPELPFAEVPWKYLWHDNNYKFHMKGDVLHIQHEFGLFPDNDLFINTLAQLDKAGVKVVVTFHSIDPSIRKFYDVCSRFARALIVHNEIGRTIVPKAVVIPHGAYQPPKHLGESARKSVKLMPTKLRVLKDNPTVLMHGFLSPDKGFHIGIEACILVKNLIPDLKVIVSSGPHPKADKFTRKLFRRYFEKDCMGIIPQEYRKDFKFDFRLISDEELDSLITESDILLYPYLPQKLISTSGNLMRTIGFGKPVVTSHNYRLAELWGMETDLDARAFARKIYELLSEPDKYLEASRTCLELADKLAWNKVAEQHLALYSTL